MNDSMLMISNRMKNEFYVGVVGSNRSGKSTFLQSFFRLMVLPNITDEFLKQKIIDELPQTSAGKQIMTVEPKFIPSTNLELNISDTIMNIRFVDCVGEIIPSSEGYGTNKEPRLVKTPWFDEPIPFKEAASIGTEKVICNHSNLGIYVTSDGSFGEFTRTEYEEIEDYLLPKIKELNKPFVIVLNTKNKEDSKALALAKKIEEKWNVSCVTLSAINMTVDDCNIVLKKALDEFPIESLSFSLPDYLDSLDDEYPLKKEINNLIKDTESKYNKVKDVNKLCDTLRDSNLFSNVTLSLLEPSKGEADIILDLGDDKYQEILKDLIGDKMNSKKDFIEYLSVSKKANEIYNQVKTAINDSKENGYGISIPNISQMELLEPSIEKKNGMYGIKMSAQAKCIHMISVDVLASFTPIIGSYEQAKMLLDSIEENPEKLWNMEFFGKSLSDIVNDSMKSKIKSIPDNSKEKVKNVLEKIMNTERNNLIAIIL